jgi:hypothetical protein
MRISQLQSLTQEELQLLFYIINVIEPLTSPKIEIGSKEILWFKHDTLVWKLSKQESKLTPEGKTIFQGLMTKLNKIATQEAKEYYECASNSTSTQPEFQF